PPQLDLLLAMTRRGLRLVESLQRAVMALVEPPMPLDGDPREIHLVEDQPQRADRTNEHGRERDIEDEARFLQRAARLGRLATPLLGEVDIRPPGEQILEVPFALAVAHEHQLADLFLAHGALLLAKRS